jgi:hypothetical protein
MTNLQDLTASQLNRIIAIKEKIESLQSEIASIADDGGEAPDPVEKVKRRRMSAAARKRIAAGAKARWAKVKGAAAIERGWKGRHYRRHQGQMGQVEGRDKSDTGSPQKAGSTQQPGGQGQAGGGSQSQMGQSEGSRTD